MAKTFSTVSVHLPTEVTQAIGFLKTLPDDWTIFIGWPEINTRRPDLLLSSPAKGSIFVSVSGAAANILDNWNANIPVGNDEPIAFRRLDRAINSLLVAPERNSIPRLLILTNASRKDIGLTFLAQLPGGVHCLSRESLNVGAFLPVAELAQPRPELLERARSYISPPTVITTALTARRPANLDNPGLRFLDPEQEDWLRRYLVGPDVGTESTTLSSGPQMLAGPAGSGKSLLLLARSVLEKKVNPKAKILFLTHNKPLVNDFRTRAKSIADQMHAPDIEIQTFHKWCASWARSVWKTAVTYDDRDALIKQVLGVHDTLARFLGDEFAYIQDHIIQTEAEYLEYNRRARFRPLQKEQRSRVWLHLQKYLSLLAAQKMTDFPTQLLDIHRLIESGEIRVPLYEAIYVDEAQFFAPTAMSILKHATSGGRLILAADPTQGFLQRRSPWTRIGLNLSGRTVHLRRPYRSTQEILRFARKFYLDRSEEMDPETNLPEESEIVSAPTGEWPDIITVDNRQDEAIRAAELVGQLITNGTRPREILVLTATDHGEGDLQSALRLRGEEMKSWSPVAAEKSSSERDVRTCSLNRATGLEAPYVVLVGLREALEKEEDPTDPERKQLSGDNTRKFYMAFTRAGFRLALIWSGTSEPPFPRQEALICHSRGECSQVGRGQMQPL